MSDLPVYGLPKVRHETDAGGEVCFEVGFRFLGRRDEIIHPYRLRVRWGQRDFIPGFNLKVISTKVKYMLDSTHLPSESI